MAPLTSFRTVFWHDIIPNVYLLQPRQDTHTPTRPAVSPALPVSSVTAIPPVKIAAKTKKKVKAKHKVAKMKTTSKVDCTVIEAEADE